MKRRKFIQSASLGTASIASLGFSTLEESLPRPQASKYMGGFAAPGLATIKAAFIGLGYRGNDHLRNFARLPGTEVIGLCEACKLSGGILCSIVAHNGFRYSMSGEY